MFQGQGQVVNPVVQLPRIDCGIVIPSQWGLEQFTEMAKHSNALRTNTGKRRITDLNREPTVTSPATILHPVKTRKIKTPIVQLVCLVP